MLVRDWLEKTDTEILQIWTQEKQAIPSLSLSSCITLDNLFYSPGLLTLPEDQCLELHEVP